MRILKISNWNIGWKYGGILFLALALFIITAIISILLIVGMGQDIRDLEKSSDNAIKVTEMGSLIRSKGIRVSDYIQSQNDEFIEEFNSRDQLFHEIANDVIDGSITNEEKTLLDQIINKNKEMNSLFFDEIIPARNSGDVVLAISKAQESKELLSETIVLVDNLTELVNLQRESSVNQATNNQQQVIYLIILFVSISVIISGSIAYIISRRVTRSLNDVVNVTTDIADGRIGNSSLYYDGNDEVGRIATSFNKMNHNLRNILLEIMKTSESVTNSSNILKNSAVEVKESTVQVGDTMQELVKGSESQASDANDLSYFMQNFTEQVIQSERVGSIISESSEEVNEMTAMGKKLMLETQDQMEIIDKIVKSAVDRVEGLDEKSQEITNLITVIKNIAEQTNLLALNATIESARAGEYGKGFAVVANEIRQLAEQVANSVSNITNIVENVKSESDSVSKSLREGYKEVEEGTNRVRRTTNTFIEISDSVQLMGQKVKEVTNGLNLISKNIGEVNNSIENIASISEESASGVGQASTAVHQVNHLMEEITKNAIELSDISNNLDEIVQQFEIKE